ncbi:adenylosuccinate synthetase [Altibacter sp.]|uniref:adenylosuccinate synthetase n=1 Tax=Altibacter sp. TaxID=2024823 RepID=UPI0025BCEBF5|nr:adenylosuccinate synthetase [Altibacter sp.]|tara:strand:- start:1014 stop:1217 length:204 start_codon:yes stop_codon:yes gene_type:complete
MSCTKPIVFFFLLSNSIVAAQIPKEVPHPDTNAPIDLTNPADVIIYIIIPLVFVGLYFVWRRRKNRK